MRAAAHLRIVREVEPDAGEETCPPRRAATTDGGDLALVAALFVLDVVPVAGELSGVGHWSRAVVGFATAALLLTGRELWSQLRARVRAKTGGAEPP